MMYWLVIVTYMAGNSWMPSVQIQNVNSIAQCELMRDQVALTIQKTAKTNTVGGSVIEKDGEDLIIVSRQNREVARMSCTKAAK